MILGLGYKARSGKDVVTDYLVKYYGFTRRGFADSLKEACRAIFHLSDGQLYGDSKEVMDPFWNTTPRDMLQRVGTEALRRGFDQDVWVNSLKKYLLTHGIDTNWAIPDVRFPNEAITIKEMGGKVVRIDRKERDEISAGHKHASEISMEQYEDWDYILDNNQDLGTLWRRVERMMKELK